MTQKVGRSAQVSTVRHIRNIVVVSDLHCGCMMGLCPSEGVPLDGGGKYHPSRLQRVVWGWWQEFWSDFVPHATKGEPYAVVVNGDAIDGVHHSATTQITHNLERQREIARSVTCTRSAKAAAYYHIRGTEAHVGPSGEHEEALASALGAIPDEDGRHARWEMRLRLGKHLIHFTHHISTSTSPYAETGALNRELVNSYLNTGLWGDEPYSMLVRSHRHQHSEIARRSARGKVSVVVTPAWQLKGPFIFKIGARMSQPEIGGVVIRLADDELFTRTFVKRIEQPKVEVLS